MEIVLTIILVGMFFIGVNVLGKRAAQKSTQKTLNEFSEREEEREELREQRYTAVAPIVEDFYSSILSKWEDADHKMTVDVIRAKSADELSRLQAILPNEWPTWADSCDCWIKNNVLFILLPRNQALENAHNTPEVYASVDKISENIPHWAIPLDRIHHYIAMGELIRTEKVIGGDVSYTGVSVNGIEFGEIKQDPAIKVPEIYDSRYVVLYYQDHKDCPLQTIYFCYDSLDTLIRLIPQYQR